MNKVWVTGDAVVDLIPEGDAHYLKCPGGAPANVAVAIARLGCNSAFFGRVGNDPMGRFMQSTLNDENVSTEYLLLDKNQRTSTVVVDLDEHGERSFTFMVKPSADQFLSVSDIPSFKAGEWLHCCSIALANEPSRSATLYAIKKMKDSGGFISFDPNLRDEVWSKPEEMSEVVMKAVSMADVVKFSDDELLFLTQTTSLEAGLATLKPLSIPLIVITQGAKGALVIQAETQTLISGTPVSPIDTTGAGDAFVGGLLRKLSFHQEWYKASVIHEAVRWANGCGALAATKKGAMTALPDEKALLSYIS